MDRLQLASTSMQLRGWPTQGTSATSPISSSRWVKAPWSANRSPASGLGLTFDAGAIDVIVDYIAGYPYFIQEYGKIVWDLAPAGADQSSDRGRKRSAQSGEA